MDITVNHWPTFKLVSAVYTNIFNSKDNINHILLYTLIYK